MTPPQVSTRIVISPLESVQRSTGVPSGAVPKGSTLVEGPPPWSPAEATAGEIAPPVIRPAPSAAATRRARPGRWRGVGRSDRRVGAGPPDMEPPGRGCRPRVIARQRAPRAFRTGPGRGDARHVSWYAGVETRQRDVPDQHGGDPPRLSAHSPLHH